MTRIQRTAVVAGTLILSVVVAYFTGVEAGQYLNHRKRAETRARGVNTTRAILDRMQTIEVGDTLFNYVFEDIDGREVSLDDLVTSRTVITYMQTDCDGCLLELEEMIKTVTDPADYRHFILISSANPLHLRKLRDNFGLDCAILYDEERQFGHALNIYSYPFSVIVNGSRVILDIRADALWAEDFKEIIRLNREG